MQIQTRLMARFIEPATSEFLDETETLQTNIEGMKPLALLLVYVWNFGVACMSTPVCFLPTRPLIFQSPAGTSQKIWIEIFVIHPSLISSCYPTEGIWGKSVASIKTSFSVESGFCACHGLPFRKHLRGRPILITF